MYGEREQRQVTSVRCSDYTCSVAYVKVTPTISNWIQPITIETTSRCGLDGSRSSCQCGQALRVSVLYSNNVIPHGHFQNYEVKTHEIIHGNMACK